MSECLDLKMKNRLHAYELGLLDDAERQAFEIHLIECDHCAEKLEQFHTVSGLLRDSRETREVVRKLIAEKPSHSTTSEGRRGWIASNWWARIVPGALIISVLLALVLTDWQIEVRHGDEVYAEENRLVVIPFTDLSGQPDSLRVSAIVTNLLITDLSASSYVRVLSPERLSDILTLLGIRPEESVLTEQAISRIADKAAARWSLIGSILQWRPQIVITSRIVDRRTGTILSSQLVEGRQGEDVFAAIDSLSIKIKAGLALPSDTHSESDQPVAKITTHSPDSYRYYLEGLDNYNRYYFPEARALFMKAVSLDSTFAMAYYYLSSVPGSRNAREMISRAVEFAENAGRRDRLWIFARKALLEGNIELYIGCLEEILRQYPDEKRALEQLASVAYNQDRLEDAIEYLSKAIQLDPLYTRAHNLLAYAYSRIGDLDKAIAAINEYARLAPTEANPYDSRGDIFARHGHLMEATDSYLLALRVKPDFRSSLISLGHMYLFAGSYDAADSCFQMIALNSDDSRVRSLGRFLRCLVPLTQGQLRRSIELLDDCIAADRLEGTFSDQTYKYRVKSLVLLDLNELETACAAIDTAIQIGEQVGAIDLAMLQAYGALVYGAAGRSDRAGEFVDQLSLKAKSDSGQSLVFAFGAAALSLQSNNPTAAVTYLEEADPPLDCFPLQFTLARAYFESGQYERAASVLEAQLSYYHRWRAEIAHWDVHMIYLLGRAYEKLGREGEAARQYQIFVDRLYHADSGFPGLEDARERLMRLRSSP